MASGVSGIGSYNGAGRLQQSQEEQKNRLFGKIDTNKDNSVSKDEWAAFQTNLTAKAGSTQSGSASGSVLSLLNLLQNPSQSGTTSGTTTSGSLTDVLFGKIDTNGDSSINKDELSAALSSIRQSAFGVSSTSDAQTFFSKIDTSGDGSLSKEELTAFQSSLTTQLLSGMSGSRSATSSDTGSASSSTASFIQQAISKYAQFTPAGQGIAKIGAFLGLG